VYYMVSESCGDAIRGVVIIQAIISNGHHAGVVIWCTCCRPRLGCRRDMPMMKAMAIMGIGVYTVCVGISVYSIYVYWFYESDGYNVYRCVYSIYPRLIFETVYTLS